MNTLRNLKKISKNKNLQNYTNENFFKNSNNISNKIFNLGNFSFFSVNKTNYKKIQNFSFCENLQKENPKQEIPLPKKPEAINYSLLYNPETSLSNLQKIFLNLNSKNLPKIEFNKNMFHKALLDISKRFPLGENYSIEFYEKFIKEKFYEKMNPRKDSAKFSNYTVEKNHELIELVNELSAFYENDDKKNFVDSFKNLIKVLNNSVNFFNKENESSQIFLARNYLDLIDYLKNLCEHEENSTYKENLFNINSLLLIKLINELQVITLDLLGSTNEINVHSFRKFENFIAEIFNKFHIIDFSVEKNNTFSENNILFDNKNYFEENFLTKNLIFYLTNCIGFIKNTKENNSVELGKCYFFLASINLKMKNFEKAQEFTEKINEVFTHNFDKKEKNSEEYFQNKLNLIYHIYLKSFLVSIFTSNKKEHFSLMKQASVLIEKLQVEFYEMEKKPENYNIEKDYNLFALKFKVNSNLGIMYEQYGFLLDAQKSFEISLKINPNFLRTNKNLLLEYLLISDILIEKIYNFFNLNRQKYEISKKNFNLAYYIINENTEKNSRMETYAENIKNYIDQSSDVFNLVNMLNPKSPKFTQLKTQQENYILSLINYFQENKKDYNTASIFKDYWNNLYSLDTNLEENFINSMSLLNNYKINSNVTNKNPQEILENLISLRDSLFIEEFMNEENRKFGEKNPKEEELIENNEEIIDLFGKDISTSKGNLIKGTKENEEFYENLRNFGIAIYYNILTYEIKCNQHEEAMEKIKFLINFINKQNENKPTGSVIDHPYLLINLNLLAVHFHLIKNQKIYSVPYLRAVNSMLVKYDWGENTKINSYLKEMVELIKLI